MVLKIKTNLARNCRIISFLFIYEINIESHSSQQLIFISDKIRWLFMPGTVGTYLTIQTQSIAGFLKNYILGLPS